MDSQTVKRISLPRLFFALSLVAGISYGAVQSFAKWEQTEVATRYQPWFAAYVDVTSTPTYQFENRDPSSGFNDAVLSFIVAESAESCTPTWGGYYTLDEAATSLDLDRRIARLQQQGGKVAVSFGGALNTELGRACTDSDALFAAYKLVIDRYNINTIDLDLENESLRDKEAAERRAEVIARLQRSYQEEEKKLVVWLTLPVAPQGLTHEGTDAVAVMLKHDVDLAGVNVMTMDYGESKSRDISMYEASRQALVETHRQLGILYKQAGIHLDSSSLWSKIGTTPMIGQNDVVEEIFTLDDAVLLNRFARERGVGRMSMWSANRDIPCGQNYVDVKIVSDVCSGVTSPALSFTRALSVGFDGDLMQQATMIVVDPKANERVIDDPNTSPYPIWRETGIYLKGDKVVWRGNVYEAKWWTKKDLPDNPVLQSWEIPWQLLGPVLPTDKPMKQLTLPAYVFPQWSGQMIYDAGDRVLFEGIAFRAKWWNQGESPAASASNPDSSPWVPLTQEQVAEILKNL
jgi:chitinase